MITRIFFLLKPTPFYFLTREEDQHDHVPAEYLVFPTSFRPSLDRELIETAHRRLEFVLGGRHSVVALTELNF